MSKLFSILIFSLYPDSPIFSPKEYDWSDPVFIENAFVSPDIEETFAGTYLNGYSAFMENPFDTKPNEGWNFISIRIRISCTTKIPYNSYKS